MSKELTKAGSKEVAAFDDSAFASIESEQNITSKDIIIPKILVMQSGSPKVQDGDKFFGDLVESLSWETLASMKKSESLQVVPFHWQKKWIIRKQENNQWKFHGIEEMNRNNENLDPFETWEEGGLLLKREYAQFFQVLIPGKSLPYTMCFRGGSKKAGDALVTQMYVSNKMLKTDKNYLRSPMGSVVSVTPTKAVSKDGNTFCKLEVTKERESTQEEAVEALNWLNTIKQGEASVDYEVDEPKVEVDANHVSDDMEF